MLLFARYLDTWNQAARWLQDGSSVMVTAPRHYASQRLAGELLREVDGSVQIHLNVADYIRSGQFSFEKLWQATKKQAGYEGTEKVDDQQSYEVALSQLLDGSALNIVFLLTGGGNGSETSLFDVISSLDQIRHVLRFSDSNRIRLLVIDDYSLYYHESKEKEDTSFWKMERLQQRQLDNASLQKLLKMPALEVVIPSETITYAAGELLGLTGGHLGLVISLLDHLNSQEQAADQDFWKFEARKHLEASSILERIRRSLSEDPIGFTNAALRYDKPSLLVDFGRPNVQFLRRLGVIQWSSVTRAELCPGLITELVQELNKTAASEQPPLGSLVAELGPRRYEGSPENLLAKGSDLVALHISDLHLGPQYPFRLPGSPLGTNKKSLEDLIAADLDSLKLIGGIDFIIASGDFTQTAQSAEFNRAREVLQSLAKSIKVPTNRIVVTAGNHDVDWKPSEVSRKESVSGVSRENYENFRELIGLEPWRVADLQLFPSRSAKVCVRVISLDSNFVEGPAAAGVGFISEEAFNQANQLIKDMEQETSAFEEVRTWIVVHHHVFPASSSSIKDIQGTKLTLTANSSDLLAFATRTKAEMILHGHEHQPSVTIARRWPSSQGRDFAPIIAAGAGSVSASRNELGPFSKNHYYLLFRRSSEVIIRSRAMGDTGLAFGPHDDLLVPF